MSRSRRFHTAVTAAAGLAFVVAGAGAPATAAPAAQSAPAAPAAQSAAAARQATGHGATAAGDTRAGTAQAAAVRAGASRASVPAAITAPLSSPGLIAAWEGELANGTTGTRLWGRMATTALPIASITKVMTAYLVVETGEFGRRIKITWADENYLGCCIQGAGLVPGDVLTARQLLYAMLLPSGADAARALAVSFGPGVANFVKKMNAAARRLHLYGTHFTNFDGIDSTDVSTPKNLVMLGMAAMAHPAFRDVVDRKSFSVTATSLHHHYRWVNTNLLLGSYPGAVGIKTGWTPDAGECLLFEAVHNSKVLIGVVLHSAYTKDGQTFIDATRLLNWGFRLNVAAALPRSPGWIAPE